MYGGGVKQSVLHPLVLAAMIVAIILILLLPRKYVIAPLLFVAFLSPLGQVVYIAGLHLFVLRLLILFGWVRILCTKLSSQLPLLPGQLNPVDIAFVLGSTYRAAAILITYPNWDAIVNQGGGLWDCLGGYFLLRFVIRDDEDVSRAIKVLAVIAAILSVGMLNEKFHNQNLFGFLGSVPLIPQNRDGAIRAQGPFEHAILAGTFGATLFPLFFLLWRNWKTKALGIAGMIAATVITFVSASSTPLLAYTGGIIGLCFWPLRKRLRLCRWGLAMLLTGLHLVMKVPVWFLIARIEVLGGNSGWHRAELIDVCVKHFFDWWLVGSKNYANWGLEMWDVGNTYVAESETGGLLALICLIGVISLSFSRLGIARKSVEGDRKKEWYLWLIGAALFAHVVAYFGITYFDQTRMSWYALLAIISATTAPFLETANTTADAEPGIALLDSQIVFSRSPRIDHHN